MDQKRVDFLCSAIQLYMERLGSSIGEKMIAIGFAVRCLEAGKSAASAYDEARKLGSGLICSRSN